MNITNFSNYTIDETGVVVNTHTGRQLKSSVNVKNGYVYVYLCKNGKMSGHLLHRLLAIHFIPNTHGYSDVDHIDRNRQNNQISNLRWCNRSQNLINRRVKNEDSRNIYYSKSRDRYIVEVKREGKKTYIGSAKTLEEARQILNRSAMSLSAP